MQHHAASHGHAERPTITAFERSPDRGRGLARDMRVRWALEEVGQPYDVRLLSFQAMKEPAHLALHPFGQIPTYEEGDLALFETGAIVLHIGTRHAGLLPDDADARARATCWMFAALNTMEPAIFDRAMVMLFEREQPWFAARMAALDTGIRARLGQLAHALGDGQWLDSRYRDGDGTGDGFHAGDLLMVTVLMRLGDAALLEEFPSLLAYRARGQARPAYQRAFAAQRAVFEQADAP